MRHHRLIPATVLVLLFPVLAGDVLAANQAAAGSPTTKVSRWESNLSIGVVLRDKANIGIVKSLWWYPLPKIIALGLSLDYIGAILPLSLNVSLNLPLPVVVPFVYAGAGAGVSRGGITHFGGGLKFRIWKNVGLIAEYRKYSHKPDPFLDPPHALRARPDYIGAGISYLY
jgi:hypothetical protein